MNQKINKRLIVIISAIGGAVITLVILLIAPIVATWNITTAMAAITIAVTLCNGVIPAYISYRIAGRKAFCMQADVSVDVLNNGMVIISAWLENIGYKTYDTYLTNLYIDKGKKNSADGIISYEFPELLKHRQQGRAHDCILCEKCRCDNTAYPTFAELGITDEKAYENFTYSKVLNHLSQGSVSFIEPGQRFSESVLIQLESGVYRVIMVSVSGTKGCECVCSTKQFYVPECQSNKVES